MLWSALRLLVKSHCLLILVAGLRDLHHGIALEVGVALGHVEQFAQLVMALFEHYVDVGPGLVDIVFDRDQAVVNRRQINGHSGDCKQKTKQNNGVHIPPSAVRI